MKTDDVRGSLTSKQIDELRGVLEAKRRELEGKRRGHDDAPRDTESDPMDAATDATTAAESLGVSAHDERLRVEVEHALGKIAAGTYGQSELSGAAIGYARLQIVPWARLTVEEEEHREARSR